MTRKTEELLLPLTIWTICVQFKYTTGVEMEQRRDNFKDKNKSNATLLLQGMFCFSPLKRVLLVIEKV